MWPIKWSFQIKRLFQGSLASYNIRSIKWEHFLSDFFSIKIKVDLEGGFSPHLSAYISSSMKWKRVLIIQMSWLKVTGNFCPLPCACPGWLGVLWAEQSWARGTGSSLQGLSGSLASPQENDIPCPIIFLFFLLLSEAAILNLFDVIAHQWPITFSSGGCFPGLVVSNPAAFSAMAQKMVSFQASSV